MTTDATPAPPPAPEPPIDYANPPRPLRLAFPLAVVALYWAYQLTLQRMEMVTFVRFVGRTLPILLLLLVLTVWWLTRRALCRRMRWGVATGFVLAAAVTAVLTRDTFGPVGVIFTATPWVLTAALVWLLAARRASDRTRLAGLVATIAAAWLSFTAVRLEGLSGEQEARYAWRWTPSPEARYLAERAATGRTPTGVSSPGVSSPTTTPRPASASTVEVQPGDSPAYLGARRDGVVRGVRLSSDWDTHPPRQLWRRRVGPAWSSLAVVGNRVYTQEQQGDAEAVTCLDADSGTEIWAHRDNARFYESVAGAGPRATPTFDNGRVYTLGGTGILNCLDAAGGARIWQRNIAADAGAPPPMWGMSASPLVVKGLVIVYAGGTSGKSLLAYRAADGEPAWTAAAGAISYASPHLANFGGIEQVIMPSDRGVTAVDPATGALIWEHAIPAPGSFRSVQPAVLLPSQFLFASEADVGLALLDVARSDAGEWAATVKWESKALKTSFNHLVTHGGHAYGFDGSIFCCVDLANGQRKWKSGRYGRGQVVLVEDSKHLLVLAEDGRAVLLRATPEKHEELGEFQAIEGKTWNHPVVVRDRLYVRNAEEMGCYALPTTD